MPRCVRCGKVYSSKYISGVCDDCAVGPVATKPARKRSDSPAPSKPQPNSKPAPASTSSQRGDSSSEFSVKKYEEEVEKFRKGPLTPPPPTPRNRGFNAATLLIFVLLLLGSLGLTYFGFGLTKHFAIWTAALVFFFLGGSMIITKRLIVGRTEIADEYSQIEPAAATSIGGLCLLPLVMCTFYYSFSSELPSNRSLWMVGIMCFVGLLALVGVAIALSRTPEPAEPDSH
jgi:hypothetical protein